MALYVGLMSGTSLDGVDGVLVDLDDTRLETRAHVHRPFPAALRAELLALNQPGDNELQRAALAANGVAEAYAEVVALLDAPAGQVRAIGAHGQTVRHRPAEFDGTGFTIQLLNGALLAERTGVDVVCDLRSRDVAAGGQGAPLVPAFHAQRFAEPARDVAVLNLGGIANLTLLPAAGPVRGFDCGPGNALLDHWIGARRGLPFDDGGRWAASGRVDEAWLSRLQAEPFFALPPPKSTGRDLFHPGWLQVPAGLGDADVMATLAELTARAAADALARHAPGTSRLLVCGGGARNGHLMARLAALQPDCTVESTAAAGIPPDQVEALAFAWLAWAHTQKRAGNLVQVTGARGPRILGALYPGD